MCIKFTVTSPFEINISTRLQDKIESQIINSFVINQTYKIIYINILVLKVTLHLRVKDANG
jgi:hypothetical protein